MREINEKYVLVLIILALLIPSFVVSQKFTDPYILPKIFSFYFFSSGTIIYFFIKNYSKKYNNFYTINYLDISLFTFFIYQITRSIFTKPFTLENDNFLILILAFILYFIIKQWLHNAFTKKQVQKSILITFSLLCLGQISYGLLQFTGFIPMLPKGFKIGGAFGNPGPYSNFFSSLLPFTIILVLNASKEEKKLKILGWCTLIGAIIVLPVTRARSAWISTIIGTFFLLFVHFNWGKYIALYIKSVWKKTIALIGIITLIVLISIYLYKFKELSASGRFFIWKTTIEMIKDKPLVGFGFDTYKTVHNTYQTAYFSTGKFSEKEAYLADSVNYAFNDYLQLIAESGIIGLILFLLIIWFSFSTIWKNPTKVKNGNVLLLGAQTSILIVLINSLFSYPLWTLPNNILFIVNLAIISANLTPYINIVFNRHITKLLSILGIFLLFIPLLNQAKKYAASKEWKIASQLANNGKYDEALKSYRKYYSLLDYNPYFLYNYGATLSLTGRYDESIKVLKEAELKINDADLYSYLGNSYEGINELDSALICFKNASNNIPQRIYPKYRIVFLLYKAGNTKEAVLLAKAVLEDRIKINSSLTDAIRSELIKFVNEVDEEINFNQ